MLYDVDKLQILNRGELQKSFREDYAPPKTRAKAITPKEAKAVHKDLPPGGKWVTMHGGHHIYILNGKVLAGAIPGASGVKKATKAHLAEHQATVDKESKKGAGKNDTKGKKGSKRATSDSGTTRTGTSVVGTAASGTGTKSAKDSGTKGAVKPKSKGAATDAQPAGGKRLGNVPKASEGAKKPSKAVGVGAKEAGQSAKGKGTAKAPAAKPRAKKGVADVRTEGQVNHQLAYDVGQEVFGSRKDLATLREQLNENITKGKSVGGILANLEKIDPGAAKKYCTKDNILQKFDWEAQHKQGVDLKAALAKKLIFDRIQPKPELDNPETRRQYAYAIEQLHRVLTPAKTLEDIKAIRRTLRDRMVLELPKHLVEQNRYLEYAKKNAEKEPTASDLENRRYDRETNTYRPFPLTKKQYKAEKQARVKEVEATIAQFHENAKNPYHVLGEKLTNFFTDSDSANRTLDTIAKKSPNWDEYLSPQQRETKPKPNRKAEWERKVDDPWFRKGGRAGKVQKPEDAIKQFGLRGLQFGHWVDDSSGKFHLLKASEALQDMADTLDMKDKDVSLNGRLALAFGARGVGGKNAAVAHYEPNLRVINLTKEGGAGSLAHEWGHALDDIIGDHSDIGEYASESPERVQQPEVRKAYTELIKAIENGDGSHTGTTKVENKKKTFSRYYPSERQAVKDRGLTPDLIKEHADKINREFDSEKARMQGHVEHGGYYADKAKKTLKTLESRRKRALNDKYQELMYHHFRNTGEHVAHLDVPTSGSEYHNRMKELDGDRSKPYFSTGREMFARVFESWMEHQLNSKGTKNHYLVSGTSEKMVDAMGAPFPAGSERTQMFDKMGKLMKAIVSTGEIKKALEADLQKALFNEDELRKRGQEAFTTPGNRYAYLVPHTVDPSEVVYIPVNRLKMVYQTEEATNWDKVKENMDKMQAGEPLEPVVIGYDHDVHDGHHRWEAAKKLDHTHVPCIPKGTNGLILQAAKEKYAELWKSIIQDPTGGLQADPNIMYRGIGQREMDAINAHGYVQSKGKGNDADQGKTVTCFTPLFSQAEGYARSQYSLYGEKAAYVIGLPKPPWVTENELGELESTEPVPFAVGIVYEVPNPEVTSEV